MEISRVNQVWSTDITYIKLKQGMAYGGGSVFIYLKQTYPKKQFWINDKYENLYLFWKYLQKNPEKLISKIQHWKNLYEDGKKLHKYLQKNIGNFSKLEKAAAFFIFNRITFSGTTESGGYSNSAFHKRFTKSSIQRVKELSTILNNTKITNFDYKQVIEKDGENGNLHKIFNHELFAEVLRKTKHTWLITYDNSEYIKNLFSFANIKEWNLTYGMRNVGHKGNQQGKELFISNYPMQKTQFLTQHSFSFELTQ